MMIISASFGIKWLLLTAAAAALASMPFGNMLERSAERQSAKEFAVVVHDDGVSFAAVAQPCAETPLPCIASVGTFLRRDGVTLAPGDLVTPPLFTPLRNGLSIFIERAKIVTVRADGNTIEALVYAATVNDAIEKAGIALGPQDRVIPQAQSPIHDGDNIVITRVAEEESEDIFILPFETIVQEDPELAYGSTTVTKAGQEGRAKRLYRILYENGEVVRKTLLSEEVLEAPKYELIHRGTKIQIGATQEGGGSWYRFKPGFYAASTRFPSGTFLRVTNLLNGNQVIVKVNDYGPDPSVHPDRVIDLEATAFKQLAPIWKGVIPVRVEEIL